MSLKLNRVWHVVCVMIMDVVVFVNVLCPTQLCPTASLLSKRVPPALSSYNGSGNGARWASGASVASAGDGSSHAGLGFISAYDDDDDGDDNGSSVGSAGANGHDLDQRVRASHAGGLDAPATSDPASKRRKHNSTSDAGADGDTGGGF